MSEVQEMLPGYQDKVLAATTMRLDALEKQQLGIARRRELALEVSRPPWRA
jgi:hypothetical protein